MKFAIKTTWDGKPVDHEPIEIKIMETDSYLEVEIEATFFDDPAPSNSNKTKPTWELWEHEGNYNLNILYTVTQDRFIY